MNAKTAKLLRKAAKLGGGNYKSLKRGFLKLSEPEQKEIKKKLITAIKKIKANMTRIKDLKRSSAILNLNALLKQAFEENKDVYRVRGKIDRGSPELTDNEAAAIGQVLFENGVAIRTGLEIEIADDLKEDAKD